MKLNRVQLAMGHGVSVNSPASDTNFTYPAYDLELGSTFAPSLDEKAKPGDGAWLPVVRIRRLVSRNDKGEPRYTEAQHVPFMNVAAWAVLTEEHTAPKSTAGNAQAVVAGRGGGHSPAVSNRVDPKDVLPGPKA